MRYGKIGKIKFYNEREYREYETHYFYDARMSIPSKIRGFAKTEDGARRACVVRVDGEQFNKAVIVKRDTLEVMHIYRRDPATGDIRRQDHRYRTLLGMSPMVRALA
jgi:hypothetical protein